MTDFKSSDRDVNRAIRSWLHEDRHEDVSRIAGAVLDLAETTPQRRATWWPARRFPEMNKFVTIGLGAAAVVVVLLLGAQLLSSPTDPGGVGADPVATASPEPTQEPTPSPSAEAGLPEGPFLVWDSPNGDAPSITMTISSPGWMYNDDNVAQLAVWLVKGEDVANMPEALVLPGSYSPGTGVYVYGDPCQWASTTPETPATTVEETVAALAAQASRDASEPVDVTMGGYAGKMITLHVPDDADFADCDSGEFASYSIGGEEPTMWHQGPGQIDDFGSSTWRARSWRSAHRTGPTPPRARRGDADPRRVGHLRVALTDPTRNRRRAACRGRPPSA